MISYVLHTVEEADTPSVSKTVRLDSNKRRIAGVFAISPLAYSDPTALDTVRIGLKFNGVEILPRSFSLGLIAYKGLMPLRDAMLPTTYEVSKEEKDGITIDVEITSTMGRVPRLDLYFVTEG